MSELSIKVSIAGRIYPLTVRAEEEEKVRGAAKKIDDNIKILQSSYAVKDKQDLLAMTALQMSTQAMDKEKNDKAEQFENEIKKLEDKLDMFL